jgi:hypothetical protein
VRSLAHSNGSASHLRAGYVVPVIVFPALAILSARHIFPLLEPSILGDAIAASCTAGAPAARAYTGVPKLDGTLCTLVSFFRAALTPAGESFTAWLVSGIAPIVVFTFVEAARARRPAVLSAPVAALLGVIYQMLTGAVVLPAYWLAFILLGAGTRRGRVAAGHARAVAFAVLGAFVIPAIGMMGTAGEPRVTALWQAFPVVFFALERAFLLVQPRAGFATSGTRTIQTTYALLGAAHAAVHLAIALPSLGDVDALQAAFVPRLFGPADGVAADVAAVTFLQFDAVGIFGAAMLAVLWFARTPAQIGGLLLWNVFAGAMIGPGAALAAVYVWREEKVGQ